MNSKPNVPDEIFMGRPDYSWRMEWRVNGWLYAATIISCCSDIMFRHVVRQWPVGWQVMVVLAQFLTISLWAISLTRWIRGMDELHRRITVGAAFFAVSTTFFFVMLWHGLDSTGLFQVIFSRGDDWDFDIDTVGHSFLLLTLFYFAGHNIFNRRFK